MKYRAPWMFLAILSLLLASCAKEAEKSSETAATAGEEKPTEATASGEADPGELPEAAPEKAPEKPRKSKAQDRRERLAASFQAIYCAQKLNTEGERLDIYSAHGFDSPAAWSKAWHRAATADSAWADQTVSTTLAADCKSLQ